MEPSQEFCPSGCTCSFSLGPGSIVEEKAKNRAKQQKKKTKQNKDNNNYNKNHGPGRGKGQQKRTIPLPGFVISAPSFTDTFFFTFSHLWLEPGPTQIKL